MNKFTQFNSFVNRPKVCYKNKLYSFPINLFTLYQLWDIKTPEQAHKKLNEVKIKIDNPSNLEEWILSQVGEEIYQTFIYGYTKKQWGMHPNKLPSFIIKRLPIRLTHDDNYYEDKYQGIPVGGYTKIFDKLLSNIPIEVDVDFLKDKTYWENKANKIIYTGPIDEFFEYEFGCLEWRSLRFEHQILQIEDYQGNALINYTEENIPYTRICEHKHFNYAKTKHTVITKEYPEKWDIGKEKYYPINDEKNNFIYSNYKNKIDNCKYLFGGRLADYKYYDMHQVVGSALVRSEKEIKGIK
jgi:UDP-galactopyranose mutase